MNAADIMLQVIRDRYTCWFILLVASTILCAGCGANEGVLKSGRESPAPSNAESSRTTFVKEFEAMRTADFRFVYVLRRKDGGVIDTEDKSVIKMQTVDMNRRVSADNDKAFIIGSNAQLPPKNMMALLERFAVENYSPPPDPNTYANTNANTKK